MLKLQYLKNIESAKSLSEKTELKSVIERFITPPQQIVSGQKQERNKKNADAAYKDKVTKGVKFYDNKGSGYIKKGKKKYD